MTSKEKDCGVIRLGVNIDHVATLRNARGGSHPDPLRAAGMAAAAGADGITVHLREDRRHIVDEDVRKLRENITLPLNLEMSATEEMVAFAVEHRPNAVCLVPEKREERTTEGGLDVLGSVDMLGGLVSKLNNNGIRVSLFVEPDENQLKGALETGAAVVELHTGKYSNRTGIGQRKALEQIVRAVGIASAMGLECHAGHGLTFDNVREVAAISGVSELNIGHFLVSEAIFSGFYNAIKQMRKIIDQARNSADG